LAGAKRKLGWPLEPRFLIPDDVRRHFRDSAERGRIKRRGWLALLESYRGEFPDLASQFERTQRGELPGNLEGILPVFPTDAKGMPQWRWEDSVIAGQSPA
jgi:transketolase